MNWMTRAFLFVLTLVTSIEISSAMEGKSFPDKVAKAHGLTNCTVEKIPFSERECSYTWSLHRLTLDDARYILKEAEGKRVKMIIAIREHFQKSIFPRLNGSKNELGVTLILPLYHGVIKNGFRYHPYTLMPEAKGKSLGSLLDGFLKGNEPSESCLVKAFSCLGSSIARFHMAGGCGAPEMESTLIHTDLHDENIFYDEQAGISLIDNDGFSFQKKIVYQDVKTLLQQTTQLGTLFYKLEDLKDDYIKNKIGSFITFNKVFLREYAQTLSKGEHLDSIKLTLNQICQSIFHYIRLLVPKKVIEKTKAEEKINKLLSWSD